MSQYSLTGLTSNGILTGLSSLDLERIQQLLRPVLMYEGHTLYRCNQTIDTVYFVTGGLLSGVLTAEDGKGVEVGLVGSEGLVGGLEAVTGRTTTTQWMVQIPGKALAMPAEAFRQEFKRGGALQEKTLCFAQAMLLHNAQSTLCNSMHAVEQRLARWLLMAHDRVRRDELELTHEQLAQTLGVRRSGVTIAAGAFKAADLISYTRGTIRILDRAGLEATACECYRTMNHHSPYRFDKEDNVMSSGSHDSGRNGSAVNSHPHLSIAPRHSSIDNSPPPAGRMS
jgi:CRP-like cAMP-binding protein